MAETRGPALRGRLTLNTKPFSKNLKGARKKSKSSFRAMEAASNRLKRSFAAVGLAIAGVFTVRAFAGFIRAGEGIEDIKISLEGLLGSTEAAEQAFANINTLATDTKQSLQELAGGFVTLEASGIGTVDALEAVADIATIMRRNVEDVAKAFINLEKEPILANFGTIIEDFSKAQGKFTFTLKDGTKAQFDNVLAARKYIIELIQLSRFSGAARKASDSLDSGLSTVKNTIATSSAALRDALGPALRDVAVGFKEAGLELVDFIKQNKEGLGIALTENIEKLKNFAESAVRSVVVIKNLFEIVANLFVKIGIAISTPFVNLASLIETISFGTIFSGVNDQLKILEQSFDFASQEIEQDMQDIADAIDKPILSLLNLTNTAKKAGDAVDDIGDKTIVVKTETAEQRLARLKKEAEEAAKGFNALRDAICKTNNALDETASKEAFGTISGGVGGGGRRVTSIGSGGDETDPANLKRRIAGLTAKLGSATGADAFSRSQKRIARAEIDRLKALLAISNEENNKEFINGVATVISQSGMNSSEVTSRLNQQVAVTQRQGLQPMTGSVTAGFQPMPGARF